MYDTLKTACVCCHRPVYLLLCVCYATAMLCALTGLSAQDWSLLRLSLDLAPFNESTPFLELKWKWRRVFFFPVLLPLKSEFTCFILRPTCWILDILDKLWIFCLTLWTGVHGLSLTSAECSHGRWPFGGWTQTFTAGRPDWPLPN